MNNLGILERIEAKLDILLSRSTSAELATAEISTTVEATVETIDTEVEALPEVDKNGVRWDERIHTSNKGQTQKGVWKRKPGITDELFNEVVEELSNAENDSAEVAEETPAKPAPKKAPVKPSAKKAPAKPAPKKAPAKPSVDKPGPTFKKKALENISIITEKFGATFEDIAEFLNSNFEVDTFDALPSESLSDVFDLTYKWVQQLEKAVFEVDLLGTLKSGTEHDEDITSGIETYIGEAGGNNSKLGTVPFEKLEELTVEITQYANDWDEFFKEDGE